MLKTACSFFHCIAARPKIIPYTNMVKWVIDEVDILDREFNMRSQGVIGSFTLVNLRLMCHLLEPQVIYNRPFIEKFAKENSNPAIAPVPSQIMNRKSRKTKIVCTLLHLFVPFIVFLQLCYVDCLEDLIVISYTQSGCINRMSC